MTPEQFCYWLQGYFEVSNPTKLGDPEVKVIREHLDKVFNRPYSNNLKSTEWKGPFVHYSEIAHSC